MQAQQISFTEAEFDGGVFTIEKSRNGKAIVVYNANYILGAQPEQLISCGLLSKLAEICLTAAGMTVLGNSVVREMEIEILSDKRWDNLEAVSEILYSEESSATGWSEIRAGGKANQGKLVARAFGTISRTEKSLSEDQVSVL